MQARIDKNEELLNTGALKSERINSDDFEETYTKSILGNTRQMHSGEQKVLRVRWNVVADQFVFNLSYVDHLVRDLEPTKRHVVSIVGKFYDPMGFMSPVIIRFKMLFQDLCESKLDWDQTLSGNLLKMWNSLITELQEAQPISIPRCRKWNPTAYMGSATLLLVPMQQ